MAIRFIVSTEEEKQQLIEASRHIHDANVDTDLPMVNTLCHLYLAPDLISLEGRPIEVEAPPLVIG